MALDVFNLTRFLWEDHFRLDHHQLRTVPARVVRHLLFQVWRLAQLAHRPRWLVRQGRYEEAGKVFAALQESVDVSLLCWLTLAYS